MSEPLARKMEGAEGMADKLRELIAEAIHSKNLECGGDSWEEMRKSGYECGCFEVADAVQAALAESGAGQVLQPVCSVAPWHPIKYVDPSATSNLVGPAAAKEKVASPVEGESVVVTTVPSSYSTSNGPSYDPWAAKEKDEPIPCPTCGSIECCGLTCGPSGEPTREVPQRHELSITIEGTEQVATVMESLRKAGFQAVKSIYSTHLANAEFDARAWEGLIEAVARDAVMLAFVRAELSCEDGPFETAVEVADDAAKAIMGEETCADEPIKSATQLLAQIRSYAAGRSASGAQRVTAKMVTAADCDRSYLHLSNPLQIAMAKAEIINRLLWKSNIRALLRASQAGSSSRIEIKPTDLCAKVHCGHPASEHDDDGNCTHHKCFCGRFEIGRQAGSKPAGDGTEGK